MFDDKRSKKVVPIVHCILNHNARIDRFGRYPGAIKEIIEVLMEKGYGIMQIPCPELMIMGLQRANSNEEKLTIIEALGKPENRKICNEIAQATAYQIKEYLDNGFTVPCVIGSDGSPSCGVNITIRGAEKFPGSGVFIQELKKVFAEQNIDVPIVSTADQENEAEGILEWLKESLK